MNCPDIQIIVLNGIQNGIDQYFQRMDLSCKLFVVEMTENLIFVTGIFFSLLEYQGPSYLDLALRFAL